MRNEQIAVQLYTLRDHLATPEAIASTLHRVRSIGYAGVELACLGPIAPSELAKLLREEGLSVCGAHEWCDDIFNKTDEMIERMNIIGCRRVVYPWGGNISFSEPDKLSVFCQQLNEVGARMAAAGIELGYHNHALEFVRPAGQTVTGLEFLYNGTRPDCLKAELDTYWVQAGGANPVTWIRKMAGRLPVLHLKDYAIGPDQNPRVAEVGLGNLEWAEILEAAATAGCEWYVVEQDVCPGDPFVSIETSLRYLREQFVR
jgi:sugar phosphate isomerase/epimerase